MRTPAVRPLTVATGCMVLVWCCWLSAGEEGKSATGSGTGQPGHPSWVRRVLRRQSTSDVVAPQQNPGVPASNVLPSEEDGQGFPVSALVFSYWREQPDYPSIDALMHLRVRLGVVVYGFTAPRDGLPSADVKLADIGKFGTVMCYAPAIDAIVEAVTRHFRAADFKGVRVQSDPEDVDTRAFGDIRPKGQTELRFVISGGREPGFPVSTVLPTEDDGPRYPVSAVVFDYKREHPEHPPVSRLMRLPVTFGIVTDGLVAPRNRIPSAELRTADIGELGPAVCYASAVRVLTQTIFEYFRDAGFRGVYVQPHREDVDARTLDDTRPEGQTELRFVIWTSVVTQVRTVARGKRVPLEQGIDHPKHERIARDSPVQPATGGTEERRDLLRRELVDEYVFRLNRHPGRQVDIALSSGENPGEVTLDYLVTESKPWSVYAQTSNTGTEATDEWRRGLHGRADRGASHGADGLLPGSIHSDGAA